VDSAREKLAQHRVRDQTPMSHAIQHNDRFRRGERRMSAEEFHQHAARCSQLAEKAPSAKLRGFLLAEAQAWTELAEEQEWLERRKAERRTLAEFPTLRALLSLHSSGAPGKREPR
jgi:hypothetical protein